MSLKNLRYLVFDEADHMLSMGFYPDMLRVKSYLPEQPISTYMFSATFPPQVMRLTGQFMRDPGFINLSSDHIHVTETEHVFYTVPGMDKDRSLVRIIEVETAVAIIFCNTKVHCRELAEELRAQGFSAMALYGDLEQRERDEILLQFANQSCSVLVATMSPPVVWTLAA